MIDYGSIESIKNDEAKIILDSGEVIYRNVDSIQPSNKVHVGSVVCLNGYNITVDEEEEVERRAEAVELQNSIFSRADNK